MNGQGLSIVLIIGMLLNGLRLRSRLLGFHRLEETNEPTDEGFLTFVASGVALDEKTKASATSLAKNDGLELVDLVPGDLPTIPAMYFLRLVDPKRIAKDPFPPQRGLGQAVLASAGLVGRAGIKPQHDLDQLGLTTLTVELMLCAPRTASFAIAPHQASGPDEPRKRLAWLNAQGVPVSLAISMPLVVYALLATATVLNPRWGVAAVAMFSLQPYLIFAGSRSPLTPKDLHGMSLVRVLNDPLQLLRSVIGRLPEPSTVERARLAEEARPRYAQEIAQGIDRFFEPRRETCPWCGGPELRKFLSVGDMAQRKPGRFTLEECLGCGHIFQNPRLSVEGLNFYYRDFYDGMGAPVADFMFRNAGQSYRGRAEMLRPFTNPKSWLDVGTGHGHFCLYARDLWPDTTFDGLDMTDAIDEAERRTWISHGYRGMFPEVAPQIAGQYDVVSMHHYLEHTIEPFAEIEAAATALTPEGYLLIEVPDPEWRLGRMLGRFWFPWFQPQHLHLAPIGNLKRALAERGLEPISEDRGRAHQAIELSGASFLLFARVIPDYGSPWGRHRPTPMRKLQMAVVVGTLIPLFSIALVVDFLLRAALRGAPYGNSYRVLAQKREVEA